MSADRVDDGLAGFGYKPQLQRSLGNFHTFAAGISYISILTGTFQLFYFGFGFGGPAYWWSWPMVFVGQLMVALSFAELAAHYPVAGSIYNWSKRMGSRHVAWLAGWMMLTASIVTIAAVALAYQITLPQISDIFRFSGDDALNAVILGTALIVFTTAVNAYGVKLMARINSAGVFIELIAAVLLIILLAVNITRGPGVVFETQGTGEGRPGGYLGAFLIAALASTYVMYGFDTASSLGEESHNPRRNAPRAILRALIASFLIGGLILLFALMAVGDITDPRIAEGGLQFIVLNTLGSGLGTALLWSVVIAITVCNLAVQSAAIRMMFAMARDNNLPAGRILATVDPKRRTPVVPALVTGALAVVILVVNVGQPQIFTVITSIGIVMIYLAYLLVTIPMLVKRLRGQWPPPDTGGGYFSLGRWGLPVNILGVLWGAGMVVNLAWPRRDVYNAEPPYHWYLQWGAVLFIGIVAALGFAYYWFFLRRGSGVLPDHALDSPEDEPEDKETA
ncbi:APC family permease [Prauserella cavernicola]|uniref:Amino acid permease n=1 Tax=Prauserella cavernicola TaxID=2800127 RepID=A0A934V4V1_9PSEU|nr:APC family permease [Prauserella cavernicola]MBK1788756.1 amino acid permease [Prauserella cavernicola]